MSQTLEDLAIIEEEFGLLEPLKVFPLDQAIVILVLSQYRWSSKLYDIYITREIRTEVIDKSVKVIENIESDRLNTTIKNFNEDLGKPKIINGYLVWENISHRVEAVVLDANTKMKVNCKDSESFSFE